MCRNLVSIGCVNPLTLHMKNTSSGPRNCQSDQGSKQTHDLLSIMIHCCMYVCMYVYRGL